MRRSRRFIAVLSQLLLFQWTMLGSGSLCGAHAGLFAPSAHDMHGGQMGGMGEHGSTPKPTAAVIVAADGAQDVCGAAGSGCQGRPMEGNSCAAMVSCAPADALSAPSTFVARVIPTSLTVMTDGLPLASRRIQPEPPPPRA